MGKWLVNRGRQGEMRRVCVVPTALPHFPGGWGNCLRCRDQARVWLCLPSEAGAQLDDHRDISSLFLPSGCVCPAVDSHVLSVPGGPLLHRVVRPVPALHGRDCRTTKDTHHNGTELDDHCRASPYF